MKFFIKFITNKKLYIYFCILAFFNIFFSTDNIYAKTLSVNDIEISTPFEINFDKNEIINEGFRLAFDQLILSIVQTKNQKKLNKISLSIIKGMIETFSIQEERFIDEIYYLKLDVSFNKKKLFSLLESKNIFPSLPVKKNVFFIPIIIDENKEEILMFSESELFNKWNNKIKDYHLLNYVLPTEDLEDFNLIKNNYEFIEKYDFKEITNKYYLKDSIIVLFFKNEKEIRILSRITILDEVILKNQSFSNIDISDTKKLDNIIKDLKNVYEDYWKNYNQINTSIKLSLNIKVDSSDNPKILNFEKILNEIDLIYDFFISKFDKDFTYYKIIYNGTPNNFIKSMNENSYRLNTQNKIWILE